MSAIEAGDIVYKRYGAMPMRVLEVTQGLALVSFARPDGTQQRTLYPVTRLVRKKLTARKLAFFVVAGGT